ncbi:hypothetical protein HHI36_018723 [Cryptolaemus montrouzieri]|uniref:Uncharacterized protein n=1 Tax=Cryptolaemus montrouzieri TaxID=559131 RepID=A0ABD2P0S4_9CUCU
MTVCWHVSDSCSDHPPFYGPFNHFASKRTFTGKNVLKIATYTAAFIFNEDFLPVLKIMEMMGVTIGQTASDCEDNVENARISRAEKTAEANAKRPEPLKAADNNITALRKSVIAY